MPRAQEVAPEYDAADSDGKDAVLRREAIYTSHISQWRQQRDRAAAFEADTANQPDLLDLS